MENAGVLMFKVIVFILSLDIEGSKINCLLSRALACLKEFFTYTNMEQKVIPCILHCNHLHPNCSFSMTKRMYSGYC